MAFSARPPGAVAHLLQAFGKTASGQGVTSDPFVSLAYRVAQAQLQGITAKLVGEFVDLRFAGKRDLRIAKPAKTGGSQLVSVNDLSAGVVVWDAIRTAPHVEPEAQNSRTVVRVGAAIEQKLDLACQNIALAVRAGAHEDLRRMARSHHDKIVFTREDHLHRPTRLERERRRNRLYGRLHLAAEAAADARRDHAHASHWQPQRIADVTLHPRDGLMRRPDGDLVAIVELGDGAAWLEVDVCLRLRFVVALHDHIALGKCRLDVAFDDRLLRQNIAAAAAIENLEIAGNVVVDQERTGGERAVDIEDGWQFLIFDVDELEGFKGCRTIDRRDCRDGLADIADLVVREHGFVLDHRAHRMERKILCRDDGSDTRQLARSADVVFENLGVREWASEHRTMEHERAHDVVRILCRAVDLADRFEPRQAGADRRNMRRHRVAPSVVAALRTASIAFT